jgi:predicted RNA binding protein YcfA (HicA-like mRNA interferase family)
MSWLVRICRRVPKPSGGGPSYADIHATGLIHLLEQWGYRLSRSHGSHHVMESDRCPVQIVPVHSGTVNSGTASHIIHNVSRCLKITPEQFMRGSDALGMR